ncbi:putative porin [Labilibacter marinus]|uniref:putative porin n=1 Tax=Labilibacter marinus TaxID=1477105 RepID=UPI00082D144F|nr:putative porin [Labilibacter marinus]
MSKKWIYLVLLVLISANAMAQRGLGPEQEGGESEPTTTAVHPKDRLRSWKLEDDFTFADSLAIDTITSGFQQYNPIFKESFSAIHLGNSGAAYHSNLLSAKKTFNEFIFINSLHTYFIKPADITFYNSRVPYTNLSYYYTAPKRRSEENVSAFFTQNITPNWNFGLKYHLLSSIGAYEGQTADNRNFNFFMSYNGPKYSIHGVFAYNKITHQQSGGIYKDSTIFITNPGDQYGNAEDVPVKYSDAVNTVENYNFFFTQSLGIGKIKLAPKHNVIPDSSTVSDSTLIGREELIFEEEEVELPVSTIFHTFDLSTYKRKYEIPNLSTYMSDDDEPELPLYGTNYINPITTEDSIRYTNIINTFQIKFNEEANSIFKFGVRAYITNEIKHYKFQSDTLITPNEDEDEDDLISFVRSDTTLVSTHIGGQIFKNIGDNFWWNVGAKLYVQGYKAGDIQVDGNINTLYKVFKDTAGIYARGKIDLRTAEFLEENYFSNHFQWSKNFKQEKIINIEGGVNIPSRSMKLSFESKSFTDYIYWDYDALPAQSTDLISAFQISLYKNFKVGAFHSDNKLAYQVTSDKELYPLPDFAGLSSNYFNFYLAKRVLNVQIGMDVKYHTEYYTPAYMPATGQFYLQDKQLVGNYPFMDAFMNLQLKRARIFLKFDHFNKSFMDNNYFLTLGYPNAPMRFQFGLSWNFYD